MKKTFYDKYKDFDIEEIYDLGYKFFEECDENGLKKTLEELSELYQSNFKLVLEHISYDELIVLYNVYEKGSENLKYEESLYKLKLLLLIDVVDGVVTSNNLIEGIVKNALHQINPLSFKERREIRNCTTGIIKCYGIISVLDLIKLMVEELDYNEKEVYEVLNTMTMTLIDEVGIEELTIDGVKDFYAHYNVINRVPLYSELIKRHDGLKRKVFTADKYMSISLYCFDYSNEKELEFLEICNVLQKYMHFDICGSAYEAINFSIDPTNFKNALKLHFKGISELSIFNRFMTLFDELFYECNTALLMGYSRLEVLEFENKESLYC